MASVHSTFSVFPPPAPPLVPRISLPNPHNRKPSLSKSIIASDKRESVIIQIEEHPVPAIPAQHLPKSNPRQTPSPDGGRTLVNSSPEQRSRQKDVDRPNTSRGVVAGSNHSSPDPGSIAYSNTLNGAASTTEGRKSPVVPIRSMFPIYNPNLPLAEQHYYPQRPVNAYVPSIPVSKFSPRQDLRSQMASVIDREVGARTAPQSVADIPMEVLNSSEARYSTTRSLDRLWEATHGTEANGTIGTFDMVMARMSDATFGFGSKPDLPFYAVTTYDTNEIAISKICPRKRTVTCDIALSSIEAVERRLPPNDGLVTFIFPKMAAMLAINQSAALAEEHSLAPTHRDEVQAAAMKRAADQEASYLRYNQARGRYELEHPAMTRQNRDPNFIASPSSPQGQIKPTIHINVHSTIGRTSHGKPSITVTYPIVRAAESASVGLRLSTVGQSEMDCTLASLDFHSNTLHINANKILELMPSLFAIDSVFTAIIAVAIADPATNVAMGNMEIWLPRPRGLTSPSGSAMSWGHGSAFYATLAEREEAEAEAKSLKAAHKKDIKTNKKTRSKTEKVNKTWYGKEKAPKNKSKKQILIAEFDLEKLSHYHGGSRDGQELPGWTTAILSVLIGGLKFVVWILTTIVQVIAWLLVHATRCFTSEKF